MINVIVLQGRLTHDPELRTTPGGASVCSFGLACERAYVKAGAERKTDFFNVVAWRQTAEFVARNFSKGKMIGVTGHLQTNEYTDRDGRTVKTVDVYADAVDFMGDRSAATADVPAPFSPPPAKPSAPPAVIGYETDNPFEEYDEEDGEDLPF